MRIWNLCLSAALLLIALGCSPAQAQQATPVTPTATLSAQPNLLCVATAAVNNTATCTASPGSSQSVYVTAVAFDVCADATGAVTQSNVYFQVTGPPGFPSATNAWEYSFASTANTCIPPRIETAGGSVLMKTAQGVSFVVTSPAINAHNSYAIRVYGYIAP
jgi:hypothetical protein